MKRKQVNTPHKAVKQAKAAKNTPSPKIVFKEEVVKSLDEDEVPVVKVVPAKKYSNKKAKKLQVIEEPVEEDEDSNDEQGDEDAEDDEEDEENEDDEAVEDDDEAVEDDDEAMEDGDEAVEDDEEDDDDEAPSEEGIGNEEPTIPSKVKSGPFPPTVPVTKVIHISNLPRKCKQINIVEVFAKYGAIDQIHTFITSGGKVAKVAYKTGKGALAALADGKQVKVLGTPVWISMKNKPNETKIDLNRERCVYVKKIKPGTTQKQIQKHFESCGEVESVKLITKHKPIYAYVTFTDISAMSAALKLHNSILNGMNINVTEHTANRAVHVFDERRTVMLRNNQNFESIEVAKLEAIFSKCGEIDFIAVVCKRQVLAFVTFKTEQAAQNAIKMSGKTQQGIELDIESYSPTKKWTSIHVINLPKDCTEDDLTNHFSKAGEIANIVLKPGFAIIRFNDSDGYCKSFLYNESFIKGKIIFIEPHSTRRQAVLKKKPFQNKGLKRSFENGYSAFKPKKPKNN